MSIDWSRWQEKNTIGGLAFDVEEDEFDPNVAGVDVGNGLIVARGLLSQLEQQAAADAKDSNDDQNVEYVDVAGYKLPRILVNQLYSAFIGEKDLEEEEDVDVEISVLLAEEGIR